MPAPEAPDTRAIQSAALACAVVILSLSELYRVYVGGGSGQITSRLAFLALCPALIPHFTIREWALTGLSGVGQDRPQRRFWVGRATAAHGPHDMPHMSHCAISDQFMLLLCGYHCFFLG